MDKRRVGVRAIIYKDNKLLAVRHKDSEGRTNGYWVIPGGGLDLGESLEDGLRRELEEELGVQAKIGRLLFIQQFFSKRPDCSEELEFFFLIENTEDFNEIDISRTTHGANELVVCEFIDPRSEVVLPGFLSEIDLQPYITAPQPVFVADRFGESH